MAGQDVTEARIIPFPKLRRPRPMGTADQELKKFAELLHARLVQKGIPSTYDKVLAAVNNALAAETGE